MKKAFLLTLLGTSLVATHQVGAMNQETGKEYLNFEKKLPQQYIQETRKEYPTNYPARTMNQKTGREYPNFEKNFHNNISRIATPKAFLPKLQVPFF